MSKVGTYQFLLEVRYCESYPGEYLNFGTINFEVVLFDLCSVAELTILPTTDELDSLISYSIEQESMDISMSELQVTSSERYILCPSIEIDILNSD